VTENNGDHFDRVVVLPPLRSTWL